MTHKYAVGDKVKLRESLYEGPNEDGPGGYYAMKGELLIVRTHKTFREWSYTVSHENRPTEGFFVKEEELEPHHE